MDLVQALVLAVVQGFTEFLPISSSGHLVLVPVVLGWTDQGLPFDVAVHLGTLAAVVFYFRHELWPMARDALGTLRGRARTPDSDLAWWVVLGTIPAVVCGALFGGQVATLARSPLVIATTTAAFGVLLWVADARGARTRDERHIGWREALIVGLAQAVALIPGTSRSGITITAALFLGLNRQAAARFSFLLSIPVILAATCYELLKLAQDPQPADWPALAVGAVGAGVVAYITIRGFIALLGRMGMAPFAVYRLLLAAVLFWIYL
ncbi:undecaprenyl-diphosphate phosphatase [Thioalkalivibrio sp. XN279]|uniref:undecaprenyl-diphosphate phosphatase n=1 Tax=Thioalkalivibrio sp. XN279 TaxID=2714953 RepID=UPI001407A94B|nr:undecaprenyl-diphosphate phosphatase [Thioalkalivibrio sp. XN279]NHA14053.1 undecaprenyl-diphosphate phosphatase [Thioalkalivibrio sp. XN279]